MSGKVTIVGDGAMGTVCSMLMVKQGWRVTVWSAWPEYVEQLLHDRENRRYLPGHRFPDEAELTASGTQALAGAEFIISAVPCVHLRGVWCELASSYDGEAPICSVTKGIENETLLRPTQIIAEILGRVKLAAISGPTIAHELAQCLPATMVAASEDPAFAGRVQEIFRTPWLRVYTNTDLLGVELAGATKNVIAIAAGIIDGLGAGDNAKAALLTRGLVEITRLGKAMGAREETSAGLAGLGDLVTTCVSPFGRNRSAGESIGRGRSLAEVVASTNSEIEGIATTRSVMALAQRYNVEMPITEAVYGVLFQRKDPRAAIAELMSRRLKSE